MGAAPLVSVLPNAHEILIGEVVAAVGVHGVCHIASIVLDRTAASGVQRLTVEVILVPILVDVNLPVIRPIIITIDPVSIGPAIDD